MAKDISGIGAHSQRCEGGGLNGLAGGGERRRAHRYPALNGKVTVHWIRDGLSESCAGLVVDISVGGAMVAAERLPAADGGLWLEFEALGLNERIEVIGLDARRVRDKTYRLRLAFPDGCPYEVFRNTVWGKLRDDLNRGQAPEPCGDSEEVSAEDECMASERV